MINELLNLSQGMMNANAMQNAAAQNQAYAQSQALALAQSNAYGQGGCQVSDYAAQANAERLYRLTSAGYQNVVADTVGAPVTSDRSVPAYAAVVQPSEHERRMQEAESHLAEVKEAGVRLHSEVLERVFAPSSPYRGVAS